MEETSYNDLWARKSAGFLLPLFSLKSKNSLGIGDTGDLYRLIDWAAKHEQSIVQVLPLNDTSPGDPSPYAAISAFAVNPLYIDINAVEEVNDSAEARHMMQEWQADGTMTALKNSKSVDYTAVRAVKMSLLWAGFSHFLKESWEGESEKRDDLILFIESEKTWLRDYAFFRVLKEKEGERHWRDWPEALRHRKPDSMVQFERENSERILFYQWLQFVFLGQWKAVRSYAHGKGVFLMGDISFYPGMDSTDVWANPSLFQMNEDLSLSATSGAPPDYFNPDGQDWGTPLYDWDAMAGDGYSWWIRRVERVCDFFDLYRLDHFRGFESYWRVPSGQKASDGSWVKGPGERLLQRLIKISMYDSLLIPLAEDLGDITPEVHQLRQRLGISGYKTFIYGWGEGEHAGKASGYRYPEDYAPDFLATTGTHDTPTLSEWWDGLRDDERQALLPYLGLAPDAGFLSVRDAVFYKLFQSPATFLVLPFQDIFGMGGDQRINLPGTFGDHNWSWRMPFTIEDMLDNRGGQVGQDAASLERLTVSTGRGMNNAGEGGPVSFKIMPSNGAVQLLEEGEPFYVWLLINGQHEKVEISMFPSCEKDFKIELVENAGVSSFLYRASMDGALPGNYSLKVAVDDITEIIDSCIKVEESERI